jgi:hypothetical protein
VVDETVVKVQTEPTRMLFVIVWKHGEQQWFQNMTKEVLCVATVLLSRQIDDAGSIDSANNGRHDFWVPICCFTFGGTSSRDTLHVVE